MVCPLAILGSLRVYSSLPSPVSTKLRPLR
ncbi:hypothetical protein [Pseudomonas phage PaeP_Ls]|nr:hypothetical protein [Pseudomonas phage PaeP_Ls]WFG37366.1 hypothetical protein 7711_00057 [Pseudomonas phage bmx-p1]